MQLQFDEAAHKYTLGGKTLPSVTQVLGPLTDYTVVDSDALEIARQKGVAIHKMVELYCVGDLDEESLPEWLKPVLKAWKQFVANTGFQVDGSEVRSHHPIFGYAGTFDLTGTVKTKKGFPRWLVDIKRSLYAGRVIGLQLAGYKKIWEYDHKGQVINNRFALVLGENGQYRLTEFADPKDENVFLAALTMHKWRSI
jgi:hypothetical protein